MANVLDMIRLTLSRKSLVRMTFFYFKFTIFCVLLKQPTGSVHCHIITAFKIISPGRHNHRLTLLLAFRSVRMSPFCMETSLAVFSW